MTNPFDPKGHDRGPLTSGPRVNDDFRSHIDRLNGPWPCGPAVLPQIEAREQALIEPKSVDIAEVTETAEAKDEVDAVVSKTGGTDVVA